jgi:putative membrane protein
MPTRTANPLAGFTTPLNIVAGIIALSITASGFLVWLVYFHVPIDQSHQHLAFLPALNALLNSLSAIALVIGYRFIRRQQITQHRSAMFAAFLFSSMFLVSYITNHALHGDAHFPGHGLAKVIYLWVLLTPHILASVVALPMILVTFYLSLSGRFEIHRMIARYTFPLWLYVSVSGVVVYAMLAAYS